MLRKVALKVNQGPTLENDHKYSSYILKVFQIRKLQKKSQKKFKGKVQKKSFQ